MFTNIDANVIGIAWFRDGGSYRRALKIFDDAQDLPSSYGEWLFKAEQLYELIERSGKVPVKAEIDPDTFAAWCRNRGLNIDADARTEFANSVAIEVVKKGM